MSAGAGILPSQAILRLAGEGGISAVAPFVEGQVQPASLDLRLGAVAYRVRASFLPGPRLTVEERLQTLALHEIPLDRGAVLETGCVYIVPLLERLALPADISAAANPKSSTGRLDVFTRVITDRAAAFDTIAAGYAGPLYAEISPRTFPVLVRQGSRLSQVRFRQGAAEPAPDALIRALHAREPLVTSGEPDIANGIALTRAAGSRRRDDAVQPAGRRVPRPLRRVLRSWLRSSGRRRRGVARGAGGALA